MRKFRLFCFTDGNATIATRGENQEQAMSYASHSKSFRRGVTIWPLDHCPVETAELYSRNHSDGWLHRAPVWVQKQEQQQAIEMGFTKLLENIHKKLPVVMYDPSVSSTCC